MQEAEQLGLTEYKWKEALEIAEKVLEETPSDANGKAVLAFCLCLGEGGQSKDIDKGFALAEEAAAGGSMFGKAVLSVCFLERWVSAGQKPQEFVAKAMQLAEESAAAGCSHGHFALGMLSNFGVEKNMREAMGHFKRASDEGHVASMNQMGVVHVNETQNWDEALRYFKAAARWGYPDALSSIAQIYASVFSKMDTDLAISYAEKATAISDDIESLHLLGRCYMNKAMNSNDEDALKSLVDKSYNAYERAAEAGHGASAACVARFYRVGEGGREKDFSKAGHFYELGSKLGDVESAYQYGLLLKEGKGVERDAAKAFRYFEAAAGKGHMEALFQVGLACMTADGTERDLQRAVNEWGKAASANNGNALWRLGQMYHRGIGFEQDIEEGVRLIQYAASTNQPDALFELGTWALEGESGVEKDEKAAARYFKRASRYGKAKASYTLAVLYQSGGSGVKKNPEKAFRFAKLAWEQGQLPESLLLIGKAYDTGTGVAQNRTEALKYFQLAHDAGMEGAERLMDLTKHALSVEPASEPKKVDAGPSSVAASSSSSSSEPKK